MRVRFGIYEADLSSGELRRRGVRVRLQGQPFEILEILLERPGEVVTRETLQTRLWPEGTHVDFDHNLNNAVNRLREALRDSADNPRFVETLPRRGYRFIAPVQCLDPDARRSLSPLLWAVSGVAAVALALLAAFSGLSGSGSASIGGPPADPATSDGIRLAVLPFRNLSGDPAQRHISDGLTEELILRLGRLQPERLRVLARTASERYPPGSGSVAEIGSELDADYLLEGSFRLSPDRIRVTARLIQVSDASPLWNEAYDRQRSDVLILQSEVAQQVAEALQLELLPPARGRLATAQSVNPQAQDAYWKGRYNWTITGLGAFEGAFLSFHEALAEDPDYAPAYAGLADAYLRLAYWRVVAPKPSLSRALEASVQALRRDPDLTGAQALQARARHFLEWRWTETGQVLAEAVRREPGSFLLHQWYGEHLATLGESDRGIAELRLAQELNPAYSVPQTAIGWHYLLAGRLQDAQRQLTRALAENPNHALTAYDLGRVYLAMARPGEAVEVLQQSFRQSLRTHTWSALAAAHFQAGNRDRAEQLRQQLYELAELRYVSPVDLAYLELGFGDNQRALDLLERAYQESDPWLAYLKVAPVYRPLHGDPRYLKLLEQMGL